MKKRMMIALVTGALTIAAFGGVASAHPNSASGKGVGVSPTGLVGNGHFKGLECAARVSPVLGELGLPCVLDSEE